MEFEYFCFLQRSWAGIWKVIYHFSLGQIELRIGTVNCPYSTGLLLTPGVAKPDGAALPSLLA